MKTVNIIKIISKFILAVLLLFLFIKKIDIYLVFNYFKKISLDIIVLAILINTLANLISAYKWHCWLPKFSYLKILLISMLGRFYSFVLPGQLTGELAKAYQMSRNQKETEIIAASVFVDKVTGILGLLMVSLAGVILSSRNLPWIFPATLLILLIAGFLSLTIIRINFLYYHIIKIFQFIIKKISRLEKIINYIKSTVDALRIYSQNFLKILYNITLGSLYQLFAVLIIFLFSKNLGIDLNFYEYFWIFGIISLALFLPLTIGGFGVREGTFIGLLGLMGISAEKALALSFALLGMQFLDALAGGLIELTKVYRLKYFSKKE